MDSDEEPNETSFPRVQSISSKAGARASFGGKGSRPTTGKKSRPSTAGGTRSRKNSMAGRSSDSEKGDGTQEDESDGGNVLNYIGHVGDDDTPQKRPTVSVNKNAGFVRIKRLFPEIRTHKKSVVQANRNTIKEETSDDDVLNILMIPMSTSLKSSVEHRNSFEQENKPNPRRRSSISVRQNGYDLTLAQFQEIRDVFDLFDTDGSASIDPSELRIVMRALGFNLTQAEADEIGKMFEREEGEDEALSFEGFLYVMAVKPARQDRDPQVLKIVRELGDLIRDEVGRLLRRHVSNRSNNCDRGGSGGSRHCGRVCRLDSVIHIAQATELRLVNNEVSVRVLVHGPSVDSLLATVLKPNPVWAWCQLWMQISWLKAGAIVVETLGPHVMSSVE
ncbi:hypothetical protein BC830DRAFT_1217669, partial [Chytriomyces sp. MP71]